MKVILKADIKGVGKKDEVINASDGYARNYLFPRKLAVEANNENMSKLKSKNESVAFKKETEKKYAQDLASKLEKITMKMIVKAGENGKIFGGVTSKEIAESLKSEYKIEVDKKKILLNETIKNLGNFTVEIKLYEGVIAKLKLNVVS
ncbi:MAG: 50S ribosomal protein L9 [Clostridia bacterium]|nr:50S ribosomal protein L9 [Clostridia bacterium]MCI8964927.1 50S ribosomal protein L9 [Clostridia bacterium]